MIERITLIGLGEVGQRLARDLKAAGFRDLAAFDVAFADRASPQARAARDLDISIAATCAAAVAGADLAVSAVTAGSDLDAAAAAASGLSAGTFYLDVNSVAPRTKEEAAAIVGAAGGRYVEAAVMTPIAPNGIASTMLLGGPHATDFLAASGRMGMTRARVYSERIGAASSVKMCRSIMIKGIEALVTESMLASRHYGVGADVLASLQDFFPGHDWDRTARYMLTRTLEHGVRRAEEMREVAKTVSDAGIAPLMSSATAERQDWAGAVGRRTGAIDDRTTALDEIVTAILAAEDRH